MKNKQMRKSKVAIIKTSDNIDNDLNRIFSLLGGLENLVLPFQNVLIKPNWVSGDSYVKGVVTHPDLIRSCCKSVLKCGARKVIIGDSSMVKMDTQKAIVQSGLLDIESNRVKIVDFKKSNYIPVVIPNALKYRRMSFPEEVLDSHFIINIPVMKTHDYLPVTLGLKNMKGMLSDLDKRRFHVCGLEEGVIDINKVALADLTIIDGIIGMEGNGPINGKPANSQILIASTDALAAEVIAIKAMGFDPDDMEYIDMAYDAGFGEININKIQLVGDVEYRIKPFRLSDMSIENNDNIEIVSCKACSSCRFALEQSKSEICKYVLGQNKKVRIICGSKCKEDSNTLTIALGNCSKNEKENYDIFIPGCPPTKRKIINKLKECFQ